MEAVALTLECLPVDNNAHEHGLQEKALRGPNKVQAIRHKLERLSEMDFQAIKVPAYG